jgi:hypothetical protein
MQSGRGPSYRACAGLHRIATREGDGDFNLPNVLGVRAVSLVAAIDRGMKRSLVLEAPCQGDNTSTTKVSVSGF